MNSVAVYPDGATWVATATAENGPRTLDLGIPVAVQPDPLAFVEAVGRAAAALAPGRSRIVLGVPSAWCQCGVLPNAPRRRPESLRYALEEHVPVAAEDLACVFIPGPTVTLAVGLLSARATPLLEALALRRLPVAAVCPAPLLRLQHLWRQASAASAVMVEWTPQGLDAAVVRAGRLADWWHLPAPHEASARAFLLARLATIEDPVPVLALPGCRPLLDALGGRARTLPSPVSAADPIATMADSLASGRGSAWADFRPALRSDRPGERTEPAVAALALAVMLFLASVSAVFLYHARRATAIAAAYEAQSAAAFARVAPRQAIPVNVGARLESIAKSLRAPAGTAAAPAGSPMEVLHAVLSALPATVRFRVSELRIEQGRLQIEGHTRSHGDAELLAASLREPMSTLGYDVQPPKTNSVEGGRVAFTITGPERRQPARIAATGAAP